MDPKVAQEIVNLNPVNLFNKKDKKSINDDDTVTMTHRCVYKRVSKKSTG